MTELDQALVALRTDPEERKAQSGFYDLFLNMGFFVPTVTETFRAAEGYDDAQHEVPLIIDSDGIDYLVLFDQQQRLNAWAGQDAPCVRIPGYQLVEMTTGELHWVLNLGTEHLKSFVPAEIAWLKEVVVRCKAEEDGIIQNSHRV